MAISGISAPNMDLLWACVVDKYDMENLRPKPSAEFAYSTYIATKFSLGKRCTQEYRL